VGFYFLHGGNMQLVVFNDFTEQFAALAWLNSKAVAILEIDIQHT
jgi:hypothetical protein